MRLNEWIHRGACAVLLGATLAASSPAATVRSADGLPAGLMLATPPAGPVTAPVALKGRVKPGDPVAVTGRIGGTKEPFVRGRALFTIVGEALVPCDERPDDPCPTPWDYCCDPRSEIVRHSATIRVVDGAGRPLRIDLRGRAGLVEHAEVTVVGVVVESDERTLIVDASGIHVNDRLPKTLFATAEPALTIDPASARDAADGAEVAVRGRIGGRAAPFVAGRAEFLLVGPSIPPCAPGQEPRCATPWDGCRAAPEAIARDSVVVRVAGPGGAALRSELAGRRGLREGSSAVVVGRIAVGADGARILRAERIVVVQPPTAAETQRPPDR